LLESVENKIKKTISNHKRGKMFFPIDFAKIGSSSAIRQALNRLEKEQFILRLAHGIYLYPKKHAKLGVLFPPLDEVASAIAKRDKARIIPTGILALNKLGWSTQVPTKVVYYTDGSERTVKISYGEIKFKKASPKLLAIKNAQLLLIIQALRELGEEKLSIKIQANINELISGISKESLQHDLKLAPQWIRKIILDLNAEA
tara:strand:+ start:265 stop:870 length:606 start_codon:yes stop_codon:yes gene_type:complete